MQLLHVACQLLVVCIVLLSKLGMGLDDLDGFMWLSLMAPRAGLQSTPGYTGPSRLTGRGMDVNDVDAFLIVLSRPDAEEGLCLTPMSWHVVHIFQNPSVLAFAAVVIPYREVRRIVLEEK